MKKMITPFIVLALGLGMSQATLAKEHHGPKNQQAQKHRTYSDNKSNYRSSQKHRPSAHSRVHNSRANSRVHNGATNNRARTHDAYRNNNRANGSKHRYGHRYDRRVDRYNNRYNRHYNNRYGHRHSDSYYHDRHYRYRDRYKPRHRHYYSYNDYYPRYDYYPTSVFYLGQDWYYYGNAYHPFPRGHVHSRRCHHRFWEPLAAGIILGSVLGW